MGGHSEEVSMFMEACVLGGKVLAGEKAEEFQFSSGQVSHSVVSDSL